MRSPPLPTLLALLSTCVSITPVAPPPPPPPFHDLTDPAAASAAIAALESALADSALLSYTVVAPILSISGGRVQFPVAGSSRTACSAVRAAPTPFTAPAIETGAVVPDSDLRRVFVYDDSTRRYQRSVDSSGPAAGVRFLLYAVDTLTQFPVAPLTPVGWMDLIDQSPASGPDSLHGLVVSQNTTLVDYTLTPSGTQTSYRQMLSGSITSGGHTYSFRDSTVRLAAQVTAVVAIDDSATGAHLALTAIRTVFDQFDNFVSLDFQFRHGTDTVALKGTIDTYCLLSSIGLTVTVNGGSFASVTNGTSANTPNITRADSLPLSTGQEAAVRDLIRGQGELFNLMAALSWPGALMLQP